MRAVIADDHPLIPYALRLLLRNSEVEVVGEAASGDEALARCHELAPDVLIADLLMPGMDGIQVAQAARSERPELCVMILTVSEDVGDVLRALDAGVSAFVSKSAPLNEIQSAFETLDEGGFHVSPGLAAKIIRRFIATPADRISEMPVTERERDILALLGEGLSAYRVARRLGISERTVNSHISNLYRRLGVNNRVDAVRAGMRLGVVRAPV